MSAQLVLGLSLLVLVIAVIGVLVFAAGSREQADLVRAESGGLRGGFRARVSRPLNRRFITSKVGARFNAALLHANLRGVYAVEFAAVCGALLLAVFLIANGQMTWFWALLMTGLAALGIRELLRFLRLRQHRMFLAQLPELARILANSTGAGLSVRTALRIAANELKDPAGRELVQLNDELDVGTPIDVALERLEERVPGRDLSVMVGTLVISQRSGGSLITALRGMAGALEDRKESMREVKTLVTQASYTGYLMIAFGVGLVLLLNLVSPGLIYQLTSTIVGQIAIFIAAASYALGLIMIRRMTRVDL